MATFNSALNNTRIPANTADKLAASRTTGTILLAAVIFIPATVLLFFLNAGGLAILSILIGAFIIIVSDWYSVTMTRTTLRTAMIARYDNALTHAAEQCAHADASSRTAATERFTALRDASLQENWDAAVSDYWTAYATQTAPSVAVGV